MSTTNYVISRNKRSPILVREYRKRNEEEEEEEEERENVGIEVEQQQQQLEHEAKMKRSSGRSQQQQQQQQQHKKTVIVDALLGKHIELSCNLEPIEVDDSISLILWYKDKSMVPIYR